MAKVADKTLPARERRRERSQRSNRTHVRSFLASVTANSNHVSLMDTVDALDASVAFGDRFDLYVYEANDE